MILFVIIRGQKDRQTNRSTDQGIWVPSLAVTWKKSFVGLVGDIELRLGNVVRKGDTPIIFCHSLLRGLPRKVRVHKCVVVYDSACKLHKCCLRRYPYRIRRFQFVIDRHHQSNHKACSQAYNISKYPKLNNVNTQIAEQLNNSLQKLSTVVAYSNFETYQNYSNFYNCKKLENKRCHLIIISSNHLNICNQFING